jgi:hypothetical protein
MEELSLEQAMKYAETTPEYQNEDQYRWDKRITTD